MVIVIIMIGIIMLAVIAMTKNVPGLKGSFAQMAKNRRH